MSLVSRNFDQLIDFTRASAATYVDSTGKIVTTPASRNLLTYTQEFDNAAWVKTGVSISANSAAAPDGTSTADTFTAAAVTSIHRVNSAVITLGASSPCSYSIYVKAGTHNFAQLHDGASASYYANFNLATGAVGTTANCTATMTAVGSGWYRCTISFTVAVANPLLCLGLVTSATAARNESWTGTGTETILVWGAQMEAAATPTDYTRNNGGVYPPRFDYDPLTLAPKGLLIEEQRSNLVTYSEQFDNAAWTKTNATVTANSATAPDGTSTADSLIENTVNGVHDARRSVTASALTTYTQSIFVKASGRTRGQMQMFGNSGGSTINYDLTAGTATAAGAYGGWTGASATITNYGNGWYRITNTATTNAGLTTLVAAYLLVDASGSASYTGDGTSGMLYWGAQVEAGAFATSYIPTVASQVTRTADQAAINAPNFASWYNQSEGTFLAEFTSGGLGAVNSIVASSDGGATNEIYAYANTTSVLQRVATANVQQVSSTAGASAANTTYKLAMAYKLNDFAVSLGGAAAVTDTSGTVPTVDRLTIGARGALSSPLNGHIRSIRYYPTRLSNAQLQALTA